MAKLTLSVNDQVIEAAKRLAAERGTSVSALVERYLDYLTSPPGPVSKTPVLDRLRGIAAGAPDLEAQHEHWKRKYL